MSGRVSWRGRAGFEPQSRRRRDGADPLRVNWGALLVLCPAMGGTGYALGAAAAWAARALGWMP